MLGQRRRRWPNIKPTLYQHYVGIYRFLFPAIVRTLSQTHALITLDLYRANLSYGGPTSIQCWIVFRPYCLSPSLFSLSARLTLRRTTHIVQILYDTCILSNLCYMLTLRLGAADCTHAQLTDPHAGGGELPLKIRRD